VESKDNFITFSFFYFRYEKLLPNLNCPNFISPASESDKILYFFIIFFSKRLTFSFEKGTVNINNQYNHFQMLRKTAAKDKINFLERLLSKYPKKTDINTQTN
jgi:hypothetical protein